MREFTVTAQCFLTYLLDIPIGGSQERVLKDGLRLGAEVLREGRCLEVPHVVGSMSWVRGPEEGRPHVEGILRGSQNMCTGDRADSKEGFNHQHKDSNASH